MSSLMPLSPRFLMAAAPSSNALLTYAAISGLLFHLSRCGGFLAEHNVREEIVDAGSVQQLFGEGALRGVGPKVVFVFWEILSHSNQFPSNIVPLVQHRFR